MFEGVATGLLYKFGLPEKFMARFALPSILLLLSMAVQAQPLTQTVRGTVLDQDSRIPLIGATVVVLGSDPILGAATDADGRFVIPQVPIGRISLLVRYMGYGDRTVPEILVSTGKETVLEILLIETPVLKQEVVVKAQTDDNRPINEMAAVSTRSFSLEQSTRFAASVNDPARLALSFAGVSMQNDVTNEIVIRGNAPKGLLWRLEGIEIPTPNHFFIDGMNAGNISILSNNLLDASDFSTGAFPAEYGNALSGVYDLRLRTGNDQRREYTVQVGFLGVEASAEGPFVKGKRASYLINYRYSTLALFKAAGADLQGDLITGFQDLNMKINFPTKKAGTFSLFAVGGLSDATIRAQEDSTKWSRSKKWDNSRVRSVYTNHFLVAGLSHKYIINERNYVHTTLAYTSNGNHSVQSYLTDTLNYYDFYHFSTTNSAVRLAVQFNSKLNARHHLRYGVNYYHLLYTLSDKEEFPGGKRYEASGQGPYWQAYVQHKFRLTEKITLNTGLHFNHFTINNRFSIEPRASVSWMVKPRHLLSLGVGMHSRLESLAFYLVQPEGSTRYINRNLDFSRAVHVVASHRWTILPKLSLTTEAYFQYLYGVPVQPDKANTSSINQSTPFVRKALVNRGQGFNYGVELTLDKTFHRNYYVLYTLSLYQSQYKGADGTLRNTVYNGNYITSLTAGKDFRAGKNKRDLIGLNAKVFFAGGRRLTPIDLEASKAKGEEVKDEDQYLEGRADDYFRLDLKLSHRHNFNKFTLETAIDIQNVTNNKNELKRYYDDNSQSIKKKYQQGIIPVLRIRFEI